MSPLDVIRELRTLEDRCADDATGDLVFRRHVNLALAELSPNEGNLAGSDLAALNLCRGAIQDYLRGRPMEDCFGEIAAVLA